MCRVRSTNIVPLAIELEDVEPPEKPSTSDIATQTTKPSTTDMATQITPTKPSTSEMATQTTPTSGSASTSHRKRKILKKLKPKIIYVPDDDEYEYSTDSDFIEEKPRTKKQK